MEQVSTTERRHIDNIRGMGMEQRSTTVTPDTDNSKANGMVYTPTYTPEAQLETLGRIAQALERVAERLEGVVETRVTNARYF